MKQFISYLFISLLLFSCGDAGNKKQDQKKKGDGKEKKRKKVEEATPIEVLEITRGKIGSYILLNTTVETEQTIDVFSQANGFVQKIHYEVGQQVKKNDILVELDARELRIRRDKAKITYQQKKREYDRLTQTENKNVLSKEEIENIRFQYENTRLDYEQAQLDYDYSRIKAPVSGVVASRDVKIGQRINLGAKVYQVANLSERIAKVQVPEREVGRVKKSQKVIIYSDILLDDKNLPREFYGKVKRVSPVIDPTSGTYQVVVDLGQHKDLKPGMFINVRIQTDIHHNALIIPKSTLVYENDKKYIYAVRGSLVEKVDIKAGFEDAYRIESLSDKITENDKVVVLGQEGLKDQAKIKIVRNQSQPDSTSLATK